VTKYLREINLKKEGKIYFGSWFHGWLTPLLLGCGKAETSWEKETAYLMVQGREPEEGRKHTLQGHTLSNLLPSARCSFLITH
jgi:hypothetical protein